MFAQLSPTIGTSLSLSSFSCALHLHAFHMRAWRLHVLKRANAPIWRGGIIWGKLDQVEPEQICAYLRMRFHTSRYEDRAWRRS